MKKIVCFGEVLWDVFPTHKKIGGAPLNVATRLQSLNNQVAIVTRIGKDKEGKEIETFIQQHHIDDANIQIDENLPTGTVNVTLDAQGSATYQIIHPRAWDKIEITERAKETIAHADAFVFGSLIARDAVSRASLYTYLDCANYKILDINLRPPHYSLELLVDLMQKADFIKFNDDEIFEITSKLHTKLDRLESAIQWIADFTHTTSICVTLGKKGAVLFKDNVFYYNKGYSIQVVDTVGAGDSFLATLIDQLLKEKKPQSAIDYAAAVGAIVVGCEGANPDITEAEIESMLNS